MDGAPEEGRRCGPQASSSEAIATGASLHQISRKLREYRTLCNDVTADLEFDVPVRFDTDHMAVTIETFRLHRWQQIPLVELRI